MIGLLCHSGPEHEAGHYFAVLQYRGLFWIVDDGAFPKPLPRLHEQLKAQIFQVWAVPSSRLLPEDVRCELCTETREETLEGPSAKRRQTDSIEFAFGNVTSCGQAVRSWLLTRARSPFLMMETHLGAAELAKVAQWFSARGWQVFGEEAAESPKEGTLAGVLALFPTDKHVHCVNKQFIDGCGWLAVQLTFNDFQVILVMVYMKCVEGLQGQTNAHLWSGC